MRATARFIGETHDDAMSEAIAAFDRFYGEGRYDVVGSEARPLAIDGAGRIESWEVEFEAEGKA